MQSSQDLSPDPVEDADPAISLRLAAYGVPCPEGRAGHGAVRRLRSVHAGYGPSVLAGRGDDVVHGRPGALAADLAMGGEELAHR